MLRMWRHLIHAKRGSLITENSGAAGDCLKSPTIFSVNFRQRRFYRVREGRNLLVSKIKYS